MGYDCVTCFLTLKDRNTSFKTGEILCFSLYSGVAVMDIASLIFYRNGIEKGRRRDV